MRCKRSRFRTHHAALACILVASSVLAVDASGSDIALVTRGASLHSIVLATEASASEQYAAAELQKYVKAVSGCELPIRTDADAAPSGPSICIGVSRRTSQLLPGFDATALKEEGIAIKSVGDDILLLGSPARGSLYATYSFLERLGVRFYSPSVERIPKQDSLVFPATDYTHEPSFHFRLVTYAQYLRPAYSCKVKINMNPFSTPEVGGNLPISVRHMTHTFYQLVPPEKHFAAHPECFALVKGQRRRENAQLCLTNPDTIRIATQTVLAWMREDKASRSFGVVQNDCLGYCECDECRALDEKEGSHAGSLISFCNAIAKAVAEQYPGTDLDGIPKRMIHTIAYTYTQKPPKTIKPETNLTVVMCHMYPSCDSHSIQACSMNKTYRDDLTGWLAHSPRMLVWHYVVDFTHFCLPFPNFNALRADLPWYKEVGISGLLCQAAVPGELSELRHYVCAKLLWDVHENVDALVDDFLNGFYGPAAPSMRAYFDLIHRQVQDPNRHMHLYSGLEAGYLPPEVGDEISRLFDAAENSVKDQPDYLKRVRKERLADWYTHLLRHPKFVAKDGYLEAEDRQQRAAWLEQFLATARANGIAQHCEDLPLAVLERRQKFLCQRHDILAMAEWAPTVVDVMERSYAEANRRSELLDGKRYLNVIDMYGADIGKWFGQDGLVELEHFYNEYNVTQRSPFNIWTRLLSEPDHKALLQSRLKE